MDDVNIEESCELLSWDSQFWGFPVARVRGHTLTPERVAIIDRWCLDRSIACLYFLATFDDPLTVRCAEDGHFRLVDARVTFHIAAERLATKPRSNPTCSVVVRTAVESDVDALRRIAGESFDDTRFFFDLAFPRAKCREFYERWIVESCCGFADHVLVAERDGAPAGCITCHLPRGDDAAGWIGLIIVAPPAQRQGIGRALREKALDWFAAEGVARVTAATQGRNIAMQVLNQRCGFVSLSFQLWYHKWYRPPAEEAP
jgi:dTDP-4-amino-4,6-dideoxy-D-galactose acyltransferase